MPDYDPSEKDESESDDLCVDDDGPEEVDEPEDEGAGDSGGIDLLPRPPPPPAPPAFCADVQPSEDDTEPEIPVLPVGVTAAGGPEGARETQIPA